MQPRAAIACRQGSLASAAYGCITASSPHSRGVLYPKGERLEAGLTPTTLQHRSFTA
jgi:hypothetical protein